MNENTVPRAHHRTVMLTLVLLNLAIAAYAVYEAGPGNRDAHFITDSFITWFYSAQMVGAALLFFACHFAARIIRTEGSKPRDALTWLIFAAGFLILALDQQFRLRDQLAFMIDGTNPETVGDSSAAMVLKFVAAGVAGVLVFILRETVLANFRMVVAFMAGFWLLIAMLLLDLLLEGITGPGALPNIVTGTSKLLAMALFLSASYAALLDRLLAAQEAMVVGRPHRSTGRQRRRASISRQDAEEPSPEDDDSNGEGEGGDGEEKPGEVS